MTRCTTPCRRPTPAQAHCPTCHRTFGGATGFDLHRRNGECINPTRLGLIERDGIWRRPAPEGALRPTPWRTEPRTGPAGTPGTP